MSYSLDSWSKSKTLETLARPNFIANPMQKTVFKNIKNSLSYSTSVFSLRGEIAKKMLNSNGISKFVSINDIQPLQLEQIENP